MLITSLVAPIGLRFESPLGSVLEFMTEFMTEQAKRDANIYLPVAIGFVLVGAWLKSWKYRFFLFAIPVIVKYVIFEFTSRLLFIGLHFDSIDAMADYFLAPSKMGHLAGIASFFGVVASAAMAVGFASGNRGLAWRLAGMAGFGGLALGVLAGILWLKHFDDWSQHRYTTVYIIGLGVLAFLVYRALTKEASSAKWATRVLIGSAIIAAVPDLIVPLVRANGEPPLRWLSWMMMDASSYLVDWLCLVAFLQFHEPTTWPPPPPPAPNADGG